MELNLENDVMLDFDLKAIAPLSTNHLAESSDTQSHHPSFTINPSLLTVADNDTQRLTELFPQASLINAQTIVNTPLPIQPGQAHYLALPTPEKTPQRKRRRRRKIVTTYDDSNSDGSVTRDTTKDMSGGVVIGVAVEGTEWGVAMEDTAGGVVIGGDTAGGVASMDLTGCSDMTRGEVLPMTSSSYTVPDAMTEPQSMTLTCLTTSITNQLHTTDTTENTSQDDDMVTTDVTESMALTCIESTTVGCSEVEREFEIEGDTSGPVSCDNHVTSNDLAGSMEMDITYRSDITDQDNISTVVQDKVVPVVQDNISTVVQDKVVPVVQDNISTVVQDKVVPVVQDKVVPVVDQDTVPVSIQDNVPATTHTSPVFKQPKHPLRSHLRLKSSRKKTVMASPIIRTPCVASGLLHSTATSLSRIQTPSIPTPHLSRTHLHNTTFTITTTDHSNTASNTPSHNSSPTSQVPPTASCIISTDHSQMIENGAVMDCSILASPPMSSPSLKISTEPALKWLQSTEDSFNLVVNSRDDSTQESLGVTQESLGVAQESQINQIGGGDDQKAVIERLASISACGDVEDLVIASSTSEEEKTQQKEYPSYPRHMSFTATLHTPLYTNSSQTTSRLATALQKLQVTTSKSSSVPPLPLTIDTPETALVVCALPSPVTEPDHNVSTDLQMVLNDTTLCMTGCGRRSMILSSSIYDKFVDQICNNETPSTNSAGDDHSHNDNTAHYQLERNDNTILTSKHQQTMSLSSKPPHNSFTPTTHINTELFSDFMSHLTSR